MQWIQEEIQLIESYFKKHWNEFTLFKKITEISPKRTYGSVLRKIYDYKEKGYDKKSYLNQLRIGYFDIESTNLNASFGYMLSWCIKAESKNIFYSAIIKKDEIFKGEFDKRLVKELLEAFNNFDVLYTHYGVKFDLPFIRTRAYRHNLEHLLPRYLEKYIKDTWRIAKDKLKLHSNRLDVIGEALNITNIKKTPLSILHWERAKIGCPKSLEYIAKHNKHDVILLERIHKKLKIIETPFTSPYKSI